MASEEHHNLASFIKSVHQDLRCQSRKVGPQEAWKLHCEQSDTLEKYATAMKLLATKYWDPNAEDITKQAQSRIQWVAEHCIKYFTDDFMAVTRLREETKWTKLLNNSIEPSATSASAAEPQTRSKDELTSRLRLLDVGSCYNPFKNFEFFDVLAIDIAPASTDVQKCDFLNVGLHPQSLSEMDLCNTSKNSTILQEGTFDVIVFSLLLEYLPSSQQRYSACLKAYKLLKPEGLLFIITPDSKNPSANAPLMKQWRIALAALGYIRIFYEKLPHIHCMAFRKSLHPKLSKHLGDRLAGENPLTDPHEMMTIPQDLRGSSVSENKEDSSCNYHRTEEENTSLMDLFAELPR